MQFDVTGLARHADVILCAIDEPPFIIHRVVNRAAIRTGTPAVYMLSQHTRGRVFTVVPAETGCVDCLHIHYDKVSPTFRRQFRAILRPQREGHTAAIAPHIQRLTSFAVDEVTRVLTSYTTPLSKGTQLEIDYLTGEASPIVTWSPTDECPTCGTGSETVRQGLFDDAAIDGVSE